MKEVTTTPPPSPVVLSFHTSRGSVEPFHQLLNVVNSKALPPWGNRGGCSVVNRVLPSSGGK